MKQLRSVFLVSDAVEREDEGSPQRRQGNLNLPLRRLDHTP